jgi:hypothetical protein
MQERPGAPTGPLLLLKGKGEKKRTAKVGRQRAGLSADAPCSCVTDSSLPHRRALDIELQKLITGIERKLTLYRCIVAYYHMQSVFVKRNCRKLQKVFRKRIFR